MASACARCSVPPVRSLARSVLVSLSRILTQLCAFVSLLQCWPLHDETIGERVQEMTGERERGDTTHGFVEHDASGGERREGQQLSKGTCKTRDTTHHITSHHITSHHKSHSHVMSCTQRVGTAMLHHMASHTHTHTHITCLLAWSSTCRHMQHTYIDAL